MASAIDSAFPLQQAASPRPTSSSYAAALIEKLNLKPHIEGGYFAETDRHATTMTWSMIDGQTALRSASTSIFYLLDSSSPIGAFHRNKARTIHTLHSGRGRYVIIHADEAASPLCKGGYGADDVEEVKRWSQKARVETFIVGHDVTAGERLQWIVDGGKYKCSFLLPDRRSDETSNVLLISETVVPGFEYEDHDFMKADRLEALVTPEQRKEMDWMLRRE